MFFSKYKIPLLIVFLVLLVFAGYLLLTQNALKVKPTTPTQPPLTSQTVDEELDQTDAALEGALNKLDADLNALDQINASEDLVAF